jgi:hypothetical protein
MIFGTGNRPRGTLSKYPASVLVTVRLQLRIRLASGWVPAVPLALLQIGSVTCLRLKNMEATSVLAVNSHGSAFAL